MRTIVSMAAAALALAGCGGGAPEPGNTATAVPDAPALNYQEEVAKLPEAQRNAVFIRAIRDAGLQCQGVTESRPSGMQGAMMVWGARCEGGEGHVIGIGADGTAQVINAAGG